MLTNVLYNRSFKNNNNRVDWLLVLKIKTKSRVKIEVVEDDNNELDETMYFKWIT